MTDMRELVKRHLLKKAEGEMPVTAEEELAHRQLAEPAPQEGQMPQEGQVPQGGLGQEEVATITDKFMEALRLMMEIAEELNAEAQVKTMYEQQMGQGAPEVPQQLPVERNTEKQPEEYESEEAKEGTR